MPEQTEQPSRQENTGAVAQASLREGPDDFSDYLEWDCESPEDLRDLVETIERIRTGEEETLPLEEVFADL